MTGSEVDAGGDVRGGQQAGDGARLGRATLPAQIHGLLEESIIGGDIAPGSRLHADDVAAQYGVSRIPVREALRSLHEAGWVEIRPRYGVYVRERSMTELRELFEARAGIESHIAALAAARRTDAELLQLQRIVKEGRTAARHHDMSATAAFSVSFNQVVRAASRNSVLAALSMALEKRARFYFGMVEGRLGSDWVDVEERLLARIADGDVDGAAAAARAHISDTGDEVSKLLVESDDQG